MSLFWLWIIVVYIIVFFLNFILVQDLNDHVSLQISFLSLRTFFGEDIGMFLVFFATLSPESFFSLTGCQPKQETRIYLN